MWMSVLQEEYSKTRPDPNGFWIIGRMYNVSKHAYGVKVDNMSGHAVLIEKYRAREIFSKPIWVNG
jgi:hypothetical protein